MEQLAKLTPEEAAARQRQVIESRVLTQEDFAKIRRAQIAKAAGLKERGRKRPMIEEEEQTGLVGET